MSARYLGLVALLLITQAGCSGPADDTGGDPAAGGSGGGGQTFGGSPAAGGGGSTGQVGGGALGGAGTAGGSTGASGATSAGGSGGAAPLDGKGLYDANCKVCHGEQGVGGTLAPEVVHLVRDYSSWVVRNGRAQTSFPKPMDKWGTDKLSDAQLMLIFDYLDLPPQPTTGQALYDDYCANCHGKDGKGGPTMRAITNEVSKVVSQVRQGKNVGKFAMRRDYMPAFPASDISDAELELIRAYVDSL